MTPNAEYVGHLLDLLRDARQYLGDELAVAQDIDDLFATLAHNGRSEP